MNTNPLMEYMEKNCYAVSLFFNYPDISGFIPDKCWHCNTKSRALPTKIKIFLLKAGSKNSSLNSIF